jgi:hypothetical protein
MLMGSAAATLDLAMLLVGLVFSLASCCRHFFAKVRATFAAGFSGPVTEYFIGQPTWNCPWSQHHLHRGAVHG